MNAPLRSGFVSLSGHPNVGKSTLLNRLVGKPVSITAPKPQTTRNRIFGVKTTAEYQAVFVDTPGIHQPSDPLNVRMVGYARHALGDADVILMMTTPLSAPAYVPSEQVEHVLELVRKAKGRAMLAINKIDLAGEGEVLETIRWADGTGRFSEIVPISALTGRGVEELERTIVGYLPEGPYYFEPGSVTDQSEPMIVGELVRQEIVRRTHQEIPYSTAVRVTAMEEKEHLLSIHAEVIVEWDSQKGIVIGKGGKMLKAIGSAARRKIESLLGVRVFLGLHVRVLKDWSGNPRHLGELGYPEPE